MHQQPQGIQQPPERLRGADLRALRVKVSGSVLDAFDRYGQSLARSRNRPSVSRSVAFEELIIESRRAGIIT